MWFISAFVVGFLGSFHCAGMCGPIAMALPVNKGNIISGRMLYNFGRILTYSILGLVAGLFGHTIMMAGFQKYLSIISGIVILLIVFLPLIFSKLQHSGTFIYSWTNKIKLAFKKLFAMKSKFSYLWIGGVNGLLPCGMVYLALIASLTAQAKFDGMIYMLLFGLGTLPMMLALSLTGHLAGKKYSGFLKKATPYIAVGMAIFLIGRGFLIQNHSCCHH